MKIWVSKIDCFRYEYVKFYIINVCLYNMSIQDIIIYGIRAGVGLYWIWGWKLW